jgi:hypothetical protein
LSEFLTFIARYPFSSYLFGFPLQQNHFRRAKIPREFQPDGPAPAPTRSSWLRKLMSSLLKTWRGWYWTVRGLMNSRAPISGLDRPSRAPVPEV